jgi:hypothetical protein
MNVTSIPGPFPTVWGKGEEDFLRNELGLLFYKYRSTALRKESKNHRKTASFDIFGGEFDVT